MEGKTFPIFDFQLPIQDHIVTEHKIGNWQWAIGNPKQEGMIKHK